MLITSVILGMIAILIPIIAIVLKSRNGHLFSIISFSSCILAALLMLFEYYDRTSMNDFSALLDTSLYVTIAVVAIAVLTIIANIALYIKAKRAAHNRWL